MTHNNRVVFKPEFLTIVKGRWCMSVDTIKDRDGIMKIVKSLPIPKGYLGYVQNPPFCLYLDSFGRISSETHKEIYKRRYTVLLNANQFVQI